MTSNAQVTNGAGSLPHSVRRHSAKGASPSIAFGSSGFTTAGMTFSWSTYCSLRQTLHPVLGVHTIRSATRRLLRHRPREAKTVATRTRALLGLPECLICAYDHHVSFLSATDDHEMYSRVG